MKTPWKVVLFSILVFSMWSARAVAQNSDEFDVIESPIEMNSSQENFDPDKSSEISGSTGSTIDLSETPQDQSQQNQDKSNSQVNQPTKTLQEVQSQPTATTPNEYVEVRTAQDVFAPYKQRQSRWGALISLGTEQAKFPGLLTQVGLTNGDNYKFSEMFGKNGVSMFDLEMGVKFNSSAGSFALMGGYGYLDKKDARIGTTSHITVKRYDVALNYYLDMLFPEPYFVPYVGGGMWFADYRETSVSYPDEVGAHTTKPGTLYKFGALVGLDWIEGDSARKARRETGLQGTYLNIFAVSTQMSEANPDPDLSQDMDIGASLVVEF